MGRKLVVLLAGALAFGVGVAAIKGQDTGVRDALGNTSAPWVVLPFVAGTRFRGLRGAAPWPRRPGDCSPRSSGSTSRRPRSSIWGRIRGTSTSG